jgi:RHH-type rel operon transcriptional repressor/antitoxin RelB
MSKALSVRIPDDMATKLDEISRETERSKSFHIQKALELYLSEVADLQIAYDRLNDTSDHVLSVAELRKEFDL